MHLSSLTLTGFKSFPGRTRLDFGPGVSVVVGPNGSGKSNVTDAVLWALGEQSPLAVRGQSMQDVIFGGGHGVQARSAAEVELVIDNGDGAVDLPLAEISIVRRLERSGEGEYRLNGARCRLVDIIEVLSDTGLGKEMHTVISQGRVEAIVTSKPRDRRLLIEEAAGLGKHRKRRRRAQLKLERTQENLDRALDVEREARSRLRPLKRQAEAAELQARLEHQLGQAGWELARETLRERGQALSEAEQRAQVARAARGEAEQRLAAQVARREQAELALAERGSERDELSRRLYGARSAHERLELRAEQVHATLRTVSTRAARSEAELQSLLAPPAEPAPGADRIAALEAALAELERQREDELGRELAVLEAERVSAAAEHQVRSEDVAERRRALERGDHEAEQARARLRAAEREAEAARRQSARAGAELAAVNQFLRSHAAATRDADALSDQLEVQEGYELALAAALGGRLDAAVAQDMGAAGRLLDVRGPDGGRVLVVGAGGVPAAHGRPGDAAPPLPGARRLLELVGGPEPALRLAERLLGDAWVVERLEMAPAGFSGLLTTPAGRVWSGAQGELCQAPQGGGERVLERRNERERLIASSEAAAQAEQAAAARTEREGLAAQRAEAERDRAQGTLRDSDRRRAEAAEEQRRTAWLIEQRRSAPAQGASAVRRAQLEGELAAERRQLQRAQREQAERVRRVERLGAQLVADETLGPVGERLGVALDVAVAAVADRRRVLEGELSADRTAGEQLAGELRACAGREAAIQAELRSRGEHVTDAEVAAQRLRDLLEEALGDLRAVAEPLGLSVDPAEEPMGDEQRAALSTRAERLRRRREQVGPVNPLAQQEYGEALAHVEELEGRRDDLEGAMRELRGVIRDTDRQIAETFQETFDAAARNFEALVGDVFPGGRGRLRLVREDSGPRVVFGGQAVGEGGEADSSEAAAEAEAELEEGSAEDLLGVELEVTPAGKSTKRLSLLSGGEKSMTALAFLFAVFLARPCPFYILDEVEAALDDLNLARFLALLRRHSGRAQFIVITHQKRTMEAADWLYGVSMGGDGVSKVVSRRLPAHATEEPPPPVAHVA